MWHPLSERPHCWHMRGTTKVEKVAVLSDCIVDKSNCGTELFNCAVWSTTILLTFRKFRFDSDPSSMQLHVQMSDVEQCRLTMFPSSFATVSYLQAPDLQTHLIGPP